MAPSYYVIIMSVMFFFADFHEVRFLRRKDILGMREITIYPFIKIHLIKPVDNDVNGYCVCDTQTIIMTLDECCFIINENTRRSRIVHLKNT